MDKFTQNYEIIKEIGRGGAGTVHLAKDKRLDRMVAIKLLEIDHNLEDEAITETIQRFHKEARAIARLNHPNIVDIYDFGEENGKHFMVIELLNGKTLSDIINKKEKISIQAVIDIGIQLCSALEYAHKSGIVHRDIKPANIMMSDDNKVKLTDFGIAQLVNDKLVLTQAGSILGSILYIPPEQLVDSRKVDNRADIYSLGVTLYQLFTNRLPFEGKTVGEVITKILNQDVPPMKKFNDKIPDALDRIILKAMKKEPEERYSDIKTLGLALADINEYLKNPNHQVNPEYLSAPGKSETHTTKKVTEKPDKKTNKGLIAAAIIGILGLVSIFAYFNNSPVKKNIPVNSNQINKSVKPKPVTTETPKKPLVKKVIKKIKPTPKKVIARPVQIKKASPVNPVIKRVQTITRPVSRPVISRPTVKRIVKPTHVKNVIKPIQQPVTKPNKKLGEGY